MKDHIVSSTDLIPDKYRDIGNVLDKQSRYKAPALTKGLEILELLARSNTPLDARGISSALQRSVGEIYRMLHVLEELRYISRDENGFGMTNRLLALSMGRPPVRDLLSNALPVMHDVARRTGQSCHLAIESGAEMVVIAGIEAPGLAGFAVRVGYRRPLHQSASGRVLMAFQSADCREAMISEISRSGEIVDEEALTAQLDAIVAQGVGLIQNSVFTGITDLSVPICVAGVARAALTIPFVEDPGARVTLASAQATLHKASADIAVQLAPRSVMIDVAHQDDLDQA
ncbi:IclR family transcriptional regulator [Sphingomonas melonis]|uniref:DNA-binding IclR family transcriptional regulator n=1 Tax=Sphingomonas melonis TaxID=152682 RepID=A0A7Y9K368_9SPHN|nr:DNA-binding IclR family transcriptional regulator [Sphingomonas melonis]